jgi:hypothetical protein
VYTAAAIFPMLAERLSTDLTSLGEGEDRLALVIEMAVTSDGAIRESALVVGRQRNLTNSLSLVIAALSAPGSREVGTRVLLSAGCPRTSIGLHRRAGSSPRNVRAAAQLARAGALEIGMNPGQIALRKHLPSNPHASFVDYSFDWDSRASIVCKVQESFFP